MQALIIGFPQPPSLPPAVILGFDPGIQVKRKAFNTKVTKGTKDTKGFIVFVVILGRDPRIQAQKAVTTKGMKNMKGFL